jgi:O-methyltransferase
LKIKSLFQSAEVRRLAKLGIKDTKSWVNHPSKILHARCSAGGTYAPWLEDQIFLKLFKAVQQSTLVDIYRCYELWDIAQQVKTVDGDILEIGVWRGGTGAILTAAVTDTAKKVFLADTFQGVVKASVRDPRYIGGEHSDTSVQIVENLLERLGLKGRAQLLEGIFPDDTSIAIPGKLALVHCDVDVYESCNDIVEWCLPRLSVGGVMIFDDYGFSGCEGVTEYCNKLRNLETLRFIYNVNGQAVFTRIR